MRLPKISVIIPVYNMENYLSRCIESLANQYYENIEIIVIDDGSSDSSLKIIEDFAESDSRILFQSVKNSGVSSARNIGLNKASGEYITFCDADDFVDPNIYIRMMDLIKTNHADIAIVSHDTIFNDKVIGKKQITPNHTIMNS